MHMDAPLYAPHLAGYIFAADWVAGAEVAKRFHKEVFESFQSKLIELKVKAQSEGKAWLRLIDRGFKLLDNIEPEFDMRCCLPPVVQGLSQVDVHELCRALNEEIDRHLAFLPSLIEGLTEAAHVRRILQEAALLLSPAWSRLGGLGQEDLMGVITSDPEFEELSYQERLYRLTTLRASSWAVRMQVPMGVITRFASHCFWSTEPNFVAGRNMFVQEVNQRVAEMSHRNLNYNRDLAAQLYNALWEEPEYVQAESSRGERKEGALRRRRLIEAGYLIMDQSDSAGLM